MTTNSEILNKLLNLGLNETEAAIYEFLFGKEPKTILEIARGLSMARTSVYDNVEKLQEKGLVEKIVKYKSQQFKAAPLAMFDSLLEKEKEKLALMEKGIKFLKKNLRASEILKMATKVKYFHGRCGFQQMMWNALSAKKETVGYSEFGRVEVVGRSFYQRWVDEFKARGLKDRVITNPRKETLKYILQDVKPRIHQLDYSRIRVLKTDDFYVSGDTTIYNNIFAVSYWKQGEVVGVEIENQELVKTQKTIFELLWKMAKPVNAFILKY